MVSGGALLRVLLLAAGTGRWWLRWAAESLVEAGPAGVTEAIVVENLEDEYLLFERAGRLVRRGAAERVVVTLFAPPEDLVHPAGSVPVGFLQVMCRVSGIRDPEVLPIEEQEPITLNVARQVRDYLVGHDIRSVRVVTSGFRSERTFLIYRSVLEPAGIAFAIEPVFSRNLTPENWTERWHGIQEVGLQFVKLWYYRVFVLPRVEAYAR